MTTPLFERAASIDVNDARVNGAVADIQLTREGANVYWAVCALMGAATVAFLFMGPKRPRNERVFRYITAAITAVAFIAYFCMASHLGWTPIFVQFQRSGRRVRGLTREIYYVRYVDWAITTPLLLLDLLLTAALPWSTILFVILIDEIMIVTGLIGALVASRYKWGFFSIGCGALMYILYVLGVEARAYTRVLGADVSRTYMTCTALTVFLWLLYPIAWGLSEGGNVISVTSEAIFYSILDVLAKVVFGALLLFGHRTINPTRLGLGSRGYDEDPAVHGGVTGEKYPQTGITGAPVGTTPLAGTTGTTGVPQATHHTTTTTVV